MTDDATLPLIPRETYIEWTIKKFSRLTAEERNLFNSPPFQLCNEKWFLRIYLNGSTIQNSVGYIGLFLMSPNSEKEYEVQFTVGMKKADGSVLKSISLKHIFIKGHGWGLPSFFLKSTLLNSKDIITPDGSLTVFCNARICDIVEIASRTLSYGTTTLSENFRDLYISRRFSDATIVVKGKEFFAHKNVLSARSPVFSSMFEYDMTEKRSGRVEISDCDPDSFEDFLLFLYTGKLNIVTSKNAISLYKTADKYDVKELKEECIICMSSEMSVDSFCDVVHLAALHRESHLLKAATEFFIGNAESIIKNITWQSFLAENISLGNELFLKLLENKKKDDM